MPVSPPPVHATALCPVCHGTLTLRRCKTAHRKKFCCDCGYSAPLPLATRLRIAPPAGWKQLELFNEEHHEQPT